MKADSHTRKRVCLLGGSGGMPPQEILSLDPLILQSGTRLLFTCDKTILNFKISGWVGGEL